MNNARNQWADEFVNICADKKLGVIAVSDHHETVMVPYVREAIARATARQPDFDLWLMPAMELTTRGGVQSIIIFDADIGDDLLKQAQGKLGILFTDPNQAKSKAARVTQIADAYPELSSRLDEVAPLRGRYIILPNVSQGGQHTVLTDGAHADFKKMAPVGGYLDVNQSINTLLSKNKKRLSGNEPDWTSREVYPIPTSDCRNADRLALGAHDTWIKLAHPTAEAIRQAFLAHPSRIRIGKPTLGSVSVAEVSIAGSSIIADLSIALSPEQNSVIGGRGSGKSSFLEYVAFGLGRSCFDLERDDYSGNQRLEELVNDTLVSKGGTVRLKILQDNAIFLVERAAGNSHQPQITYPDGSKQSVTVKELRSLFPAVVYGQSELAEIGKQAAKKTDLTDLLQFVSSEYKREDDRLLTRIESAKASVRLAVDKLFQAWSLGAETRKLTATRSSVRERVSALEKTLPTLSTDDQSKVDQFEATSQFEGKRAQASKHADRMVEEVAAALTELGGLRDTKSAAGDEAEGFQDAYTNMHNAFVRGVAALRDDLKEHRETVRIKEDVWAKKYLATRVARDGVLEKFGAHKSVTAQIIKLKEELNGITDQLGDLETKLKAYEDPSKDLRNAASELRAAAESRATRTKAWANEIEALSNNKIRAEVSASGDVTEVREGLDAVAQKTGSQEATRLQKLESAVGANGVWETLEKVRSDVSSLLHWRLMGSADGEEKPRASSLFDLLGSSDKVRGLASDLVDATRLTAIATAIPKPEIALFFRDGGRQISFEKASEGQRAAALLFMLLEQEGGPLLIDQPEGDLDNSIITELTNKLHAAKQKRQLLFASHNANIVVNGSSELVGHLHVEDDGRRDFETAGAIDDPEVRSVITKTMEGGEKAFRDRQQKYGF